MWLELIFFKTKLGNVQKSPALLLCWPLNKISAIFKHSATWKWPALLKPKKAWDVGMLNSGSAAKAMPSNLWWNIQPPLQISILEAADNQCFCHGTWRRNASLGCSRTLEKTDPRNWVSPKWKWKCVEQLICFILPCKGGRNSIALSWKR